MAKPLDQLGWQIFFMQPVGTNKETKEFEIPRASPGTSAKIVVYLNNNRKNMQKTIQNGKKTIQNGTKTIQNDTITIQNGTKT